MEVQDFGKTARFIMKRLYSKVGVADAPFVTMSELLADLNAHYNESRNDSGNELSIPFRISAEELYGFIIELEEADWIKRDNYFAPGIGYYSLNSQSGIRETENVDVYISPTFKGHTFHERLLQYRIQYWGNIFFMFASPLAVAIFTWFITK